ncbi:c-type cyclin [Niveomyces insectorum RCEF 264]|uniref:RNA polymerase II holoenzyme cyclin-like subunit n=1 Tax=Niveomyces insectorum RCEF 264 TaxID=1081102 RepID=A0A167QT91_9HYPO|nr:c-type cyclin [Niveomyces insectorum RCEF 264]
MAANYWTSTQLRFWVFSKEALAGMRQRKQDEERSLVQMYPLPECRHLNLFFFQQLIRLGKRMQVRQQALATAQVYLKRFYCTVEIRRTNPYLVAATALYLACKTEEAPQHIRQVVQEAKALWPDMAPCLETARIGECEFALIAEMRSQLIVHAPYRTLQTLQAELALAPDELAQAWTLVNDHYLTDLPLLHPPHVVAVTALFLVLVLQPSASSVPGVAGVASNVSVGLGMGGGVGSGGGNAAGAGSGGGAGAGAGAGLGSSGSTSGLGGLSSAMGGGGLSGGLGGGGGGVGGAGGADRGPSYMAPLSALASLSSLGPGSSTPSGTPSGGGAGGLGPGTPGLGGATPTTATGPGAALAQAQARAAAAAQNNSASGNSSNNNNNPGNTNNAGQGPVNSSAASADDGVSPQDGGRGTTIQWLIKWLAESGFDMDAIIDCTQEMISLYVCADEYNEKQTREQINRFIKARGLDR